LAVQAPQSQSPYFPSRLAELQQDPTKGIPAGKVFSRLEARHRANMAKAK
jgi:antitoxin ParD1/3/4